MPERVIRARVRRDGEGPPDTATQIAMEVMTDPKIPLLDQLRIEASVIAPVLNALRAELGRRRADDLVMSALRDQRREVGRRLGSLFAGTTREKFAMFVAGNAARVGGDIDFEILKQDDSVMDVDITGCRFAELFHALGEPQLGAALACECDDHAAEVIGPELEYSRTQTIMKGASCCDFRYRIKDEN